LGRRFYGEKRVARNIHLLVFALDDRLYALRLAQVDRVIRAVDATPLPQAPDVVMGAVNFQGKIIPLLDARRRFGLAPREIGIDDQFIIANMTRANTSEAIMTAASTAQRTVAIAVDAVKDVAHRPEHEITAAEKFLRPLNYVDGVIQLEDGLALIHDLNRFFSIDEDNALQAALTAEGSHVAQNR
jgi:purine-binding chemotaxis protein CheW